jgi:hypothetical protein
MSDVRPNTSIKLYFVEKACRYDYDVPREAVPEFAARLGFHGATPYRLKSRVPFWVFRTFIESLTNQRKPTVTKENVLHLLPLAKEFCLGELTSECEAFPVPVAQFLSLSEELHQLKRQISALSKSQSQTQERFDAQKRELEHLRSELGELKSQTRETWGSQLQTHDLRVNLRQTQQIRGKAQMIEPPMLPGFPSDYQ